MASRASPVCGPVRKPTALPAFGAPAAEAGIETSRRIVASGTARGLGEICSNDRDFDKADGVARVEP